MQKIGEGWFSKVYLCEHRPTRQELVLKAVNISDNKGCSCSKDHHQVSSSDNEVGGGEDRCCVINSQDFLREYQNSCLLSSHAHVINVYDVIFRLDNVCMFAVEYAAFGDLTSNITGDGIGIGEMATKSVAKQIGKTRELPGFALVNISNGKILWEKATLI